jgi:hypothetical protein
LEESLKSPTLLLKPILADAGIRCGTSTDRDLKTITARIEHEGLSFLTIALPKFGQDLQKGLDQGFVDDDLFVGYARTGGLPRFLGGFLRLVFDERSGRLLDEPSIEAIRCIRQITLMFAKINLPCTDKRTRDAITRYIETEQDVRVADARLTEADASRFQRIGFMLWSNLFSQVSNRLYSEGILPKHGPGATADRLRGNAKWNLKQWTSRLEEAFPHWEMLIPSESFLSRTDDVTILSPGAEMPVRVITVPKTLKTPRIIAVEPTCMQFVQQGILRLMVEEIRKDDNSRNFVMFDSQEPNRLLARKGSKIGTLATLDLSEASDRVSNQHVRSLLMRFGLLSQAVDACRSRKADVPGHGVIRLAKFASMGSALCFPMESLVFMTVIFCGIEKAQGRPLTVEAIRSFYGKVRVYGDDIIVPVDYVLPVIEELETFGFRVGRDKSFWTGKFRESCGAEFYDGRDVSIVRVRELLPTTRQDVDELTSTVSLRNQLYNGGWENTVDMLDIILGEIIPFPVVEPTSALLGRWSFEPYQAESHHPTLQYPLVKGVVRMSKSPESLLEDYGALMKWFLTRGEHPFEDKDHLRRAGRPVSARIKTRWARPY